MTADLDLELVRKAYPEHVGRSLEALRSLRVALVDEIAGRHEPTSRRQRARRRARPVLSLAIAGAAALALAAIMLSGIWRVGAVRPDPAAAAVLQRAARAVEVSGNPGVLGPGGYWYMHARFTSDRIHRRRGRQYAALVTYEIESWTARNGSGRVVTRPIGATFPTAGDRLE